MSDGHPRVAERLKATLNRRSEVSAIAIKLPVNSSHYSAARARLASVLLTGGYAMKIGNTLCFITTRFVLSPRSPSYASL